MAFRPGLNIGLDARIRSVHQDLTSTGSPFRAFNFSNEGYKRDGVDVRWLYPVSTDGTWPPKVKYRPFAGHSNISFQHSLYFPIGKNLEGSNETGFIDWNAPVIMDPGGFMTMSFSEHITILYRS